MRGDRLMLGLISRFIPAQYVWMVVAGALVVSHGAVGALGFDYGATRTESAWKGRHAKMLEKKAEEKDALRIELAARDEALRKLEQERADAVIQVRTEFLPAKEVVRRVVVEKPVYRDCRLGDDGLRDAINAALRGQPGAAGPAIDGRQAGVPG